MLAVETSYLVSHQFNFYPNLVIYEPPLFFYESSDPGIVYYHFIPNWPSGNLGMYIRGNQ